nr:MAG TPA: hypothetical protein [Caudoviricetes sp.]
MKTPYGAFFYTHFRKSPAFRRVFSYPAAPARRPDENALRGVFLYPFQEITRLPAGLFISSRTCPATRRDRKACGSHGKDSGERSKP